MELSEVLGTLKKHYRGICEVLEFLDRAEALPKLVAEQEARLVELKAECEKQHSQVLFWNSMAQGYKRAAEKAKAEGEDLEKKFGPMMAELARIKAKLG